MIVTIKQVVESTIPPQQLDAQWIDISEEPAVLKAYIGGEWKSISGKTPTPNVKTVNNVAPDANGNVNVQGGEGTTDYNNLNNKPQIGGTTLQGNKSLDDLDIQSKITPSNKIPYSNISGTPDAPMQSDWDETDSSSLAFIKNKPTISEGSVLYHSLGQNTDGAIDQKVVTDALNTKASSSDIPTTLSQLSQDSTHRLVSDSEKSTWNGKQDSITDISTIRTNAQAGKSASDTIADYGNIVTHNVSEFATASQGSNADTALQPSALNPYRTAENQNEIDEALETAITVKYTKPSSGIPSTDMTTEVQTTLGKVTTLEQEVGELANPTIASSIPAGGILPNVEYNLGLLTGTVNIILATPTDPTKSNPYFFTFETGSNTLIAWPTGLEWEGGTQPTFSANKHYEILIRNGYASSIEFNIKSV